MIRQNPPKKKKLITTIIYNWNFFYSHYIYKKKSWDFIFLIETRYSFNSWPFFISYEDKFVSTCCLMLIKSIAFFFFFFFILCFSHVKIRCSSLSILGITKKGCIVLWRYIYIFKSYARRFLEYQKRFFFFFAMHLKSNLQWIIHLTASFLYQNHRVICVASSLYIIQNSTKFDTLCDARKETST